MLSILLFACSHRLVACYDRYESLYFQIFRIFVCVFEREAEIFVHHFINVIRCILCHTTYKFDGLTATEFGIVYHLSFVCCNFIRYLCSSFCLCLAFDAKSFCFVWFVFIYSAFTFFSSNFRFLQFNTIRVHLIIFIGNK